MNLSEFEGEELNLIQKYLDSDLLSKDLSDSKSARSSLGIGMPEVRAIHKRMKVRGQHVKTFREYIEWYRNACSMSGSYGAHVDL